MNYIEKFRRGRYIQKFAVGGVPVVGKSYSPNYASFKSLGSDQYSFTPRQFSYNADQTNEILSRYNDWGPDRNMSWQQFQEYAKTGKKPDSTTTSTNSNPSNSTSSYTPMKASSIYADVSSDRDLTQAEHEYLMTNDREYRMMQRLSQQQPDNTEQTTEQTTDGSTNQSSAQNTGNTSKPIKTVRDDNWYVTKANNQLAALGFKNFRFTSKKQIQDFQRSLGLTGTAVDGDFGGNTLNTYRNKVNSGMYLATDGIMHQRTASSQTTQLPGVVVTAKSTPKKDIIIYNGVDWEKADDGDYHRVDGKPGIIKGNLKGVPNSKIRRRSGSYKNHGKYELSEDGSDLIYRGMHYYKQPDGSFKSDNGYKIINPRRLK